MRGTAALELHGPGLCVSAPYHALAVQGDFIGTLGMYIVEKACRDMAGARTQAGCPVSFSVNILPLELEDPSLQIRF